MGQDLQNIRNIVNDKTLNAAQKARYLSLEAENMLPYPDLDEDTARALDERVLCDLYEGHAPYKPRYVLPDYGIILSKGSAYLEIAAPQNLDEAINTLMIAYHQVPSVTGIPVYIGHLDKLLLPFCDGVNEEELYQKIKRFWIYLDRTLPDAFMHANIGPTDNIVARTILRVDAELKQIAPNLTFLYDPQVSTDAILEMATDNIVECSKPHIANHPIHAATFDDHGYGIVSCYNALPVAGGAATLVRTNLKEVALRADDEGHFFEKILPHYMALNFRLIEKRMAYLFEQSNFFTSFLVEEGWIHKDRFTAMFGIFGMAEAVNILQKKAGRTGQYGFDAAANELGYHISEFLAQRVETTPVRHAWRNRALLHSQAGISLDQDVTPGVRIPYGTEPDPVSHIQALQPHHAYYPSGISEILTVDETIKNNPKALFQLCKGGLASGLREFTANVASNDLVRVTGYMIRLSDVHKHNNKEGSRTNTTVLGAEAVAGTGILERKPRVVGHELAPSYSQ
jgi:YjjI family glycine radical enzyme